MQNNCTKADQKSRVWLSFNLKVVVSAFSAAYCGVRQSYEFPYIKRNILTNFYRGLTMQKIAHVLLIENSTAGNSPKLFEAQRIEIEHENDTVVQGVDGHIPMCQDSCRLNPARNI